MEVLEFARRFPKVYHLTFAGNLESIRTHGLLSANALADRYHFTQEERFACIEKRRLCNQELYGITLRDQHAAVEKKMKSCLVNVTVPEWFVLLNSKIFFFVEIEKAEALRERYGDYESRLLEVDTAKLLATYANQITLCRINSGAFLYNPRPRGRNSFISVSEYRYKNKRDTPAELTVDSAIPDILAISRVVPTLEDQKDARIAAERLETPGKLTSLEEIGRKFCLTER